MSYVELFPWKLKHRDEFDVGLRLWNVFRDTAFTTLSLLEVRSGEQPEHTRFSCNTSLSYITTTFSPLGLRGEGDRVHLGRDLPRHLLRRKDVPDGPRVHGPVLRHQQLQ